MELDVVLDTSVFQWFNKAVNMMIYLNRTMLQVLINFSIPTLPVRFVRITKLEFQWFPQAILLRKVRTFQNPTNIALLSSSRFRYVNSPCSTKLGRTSFLECDVCDSIILLNNKEQLFPIAGKFLFPPEWTTNHSQISTRSSIIIRLVIIMLQSSGMSSGSA